MNILLLGKRGQVGWELLRSLSPLGNVIAPDRKNENLCGDLMDLSGLRETVRKVRPSLIVNAAAYTAVDKAEEERDLATKINAEAPALLAEEARALGALLVHYSTDYVFDGQDSKPRLETEQPAPLNHYGASKLAGEQAIQASGCNHLIFRTSWVYASRGHNFLASMQRLIQEREALSIVSDQVGAPTSAELIADLTALASLKALNNPELSGLYHLVASGETSWHNYAITVAEWLRSNGIAIRAELSNIKPIPTADYPTPAKRPLNSRLDTTKLRATFNVSLPSWQFGVERALIERTERG